MTKTGGDSFTAPLLKKSLSTNTCREQRKTWVCPARLFPSGGKARPLSATRAQTTYHIDQTHTIPIWIGEAAKKGARHNVLLLLTFHRVLEARVQ